MRYRGRPVGIALNHALDHAVNPYATSSYASYCLNSCSRLDTQRPEAHSTSGYRSLKKRRMTAAWHLLSL
ncbi:hypothetical protein SAMN05446635_5304 [Burkholderia sp. OK233]|nr:hypothetical protein SAMN05446635_5304 [Burkholderia sp. OK233]